MSRSEWETRPAAGVSSRAAGSLEFNNVIVSGAGMVEKMQAAIELAERGYPVLPCQPNDKRPATAHGLLDATLDVEIIARWWDDRPELNPAIRTDGLVVVDIDPGATWPGDPARELELSAAPTAATPRGGRHHVYRAPHDRLSNTAGKLAPNVDTRACSKGYILVAPSEVGGRHYRWLSPLDCSPDALPLPPDWLLQALEPKSNGTALQVRHTLLTHPGEKPGRRNAVLCELVGAHLAEHGATADLPELAMAWAKRCEPEYPTADVIKSVTNLMAKHERTNGGKAKPPPAAATRLEIFRGDEITIEPVQWLWKGRLPQGMLSLLSGDPGQGKTTVAIDVAARVTTGRDFSDGSPCPLGKVLFYTTEDSFRHVILPRFVAAGGDVTRLHLVGMVMRADGTEDILLLDRDLPRLRDALHGLGNVKLLTIDPISAVLGDTINENRNADVRRALSPLAKLMEETGVTTWGISHSGKAADGRKAVHRTLGSIAFVAASRTAWCVVEDPEDENRKLFLPQKNNLARVDGLAFTLKPVEVQGCDVAIVEWESGPVRDRLDNLGSQRGNDAFAAAVDFLQTHLNEPTPAREIIAAGKLDGITERTLKAAKKSLGIASRRQGSGDGRGRGEWLWFPPPTLVLSGGNQPTFKGAEPPESFKGAVESCTLKEQPQTII